MPNALPSLLVVGKTGFVMCRYLNMETAEKAGATAAMVTGVKSFNGILRAGVKLSTSGTQALGIRTGMRGKGSCKNSGLISRPWRASL